MISTSLPEGITLRVMKSSDLPHVRALHRYLLPASYPPAFFIQLLVSPQRLCLVATEHSGAIVGFASATIVSQADSIGGYAPDTPADRDCSEFLSDIPRMHVTLLTLGVLSAYQRRGIGRSLVHAVIQRLEGSCSSAAHKATNQISHQDNKVSVLVQVQVAPSNSVGKRFYAHLGMIDQRAPNDLRLHLGPGSRTSVMAGVLCV